MWLGVGVDMDTSTRYIEMCKSAKEIQRIRAISPSVHDKELVPHCGCSPTGDFGFTDIKNKIFVWLPRQDQLQELCGNIFPPYTYLIKNVEDYCSENQAYWDCFDSGEQFWLGYYMATKHNKHWDGKGWKKANAQST